MMAEQVKVDEKIAKLVIEKVRNGYIVSRQDADAEGSGGLFSGPPVEEFVFRTLAEVVEFLGEHYQEPTRALQ